MSLVTVSCLAPLDIARAQYLPELSNSAPAGMAIGAVLALTLILAIIIFRRSAKARSRQSSMQLLTGVSATPPDFVQPGTGSEHLEPNTTASSPAPLVTAKPEVLRELMVRSSAHDHFWEPEIYQHPYVKKLEDRVQRLEMKYEAQVRRTEEIQIKALEQLVELHGMLLVGQSKTLADFMQQAKHWLVGSEPREANGPDEQTPSV